MSHTATDTFMKPCDRQFLLRAARLALRGHGGAEPNPLVGCVIVSPHGQSVGWGYHRKYGEAHAEIHALRRAGMRAAGATLYTTLEPCNHQGKTGPCTQAIINAKIARVVIARRDPYPPAAGGVERLRAAGVAVDVMDDFFPARAVSDPFVHRLHTGMPWVVAKWAQTIDGRIATRTGESQWISNDVSRRMVHRERGRVDAIVTGIGTVLKDDPMLTARGVRIRRIAKRVVVDPKLDIPLTAKLVTMASVAPTIISCNESAFDSNSEKAAQLRERGVQLFGFKAVQGSCGMRPLLRMLVEQFEAATVLVESGAGLLSRLFAEGLVNEAWVFVAPLLLGDAHASSAVSNSRADRLIDGLNLKLQSIQRRGGDVILRYRI
jgi:diaminohydroxyphosphoribosylaminopyrimidine deaminase/5-amino-6-(5-phosphoribosylamino)uracil reductase